MKLFYTYKVVTIFALLSFILSFSCESAKNTNAVKSPFSVETISLTKSGMMGSSTVEITKQETSSSSLNRGAETETIKIKTNANDWNELNKLISEIDLTQMDSWESPTQARFYDGARATTISVVADSVTYNSQSFDEGQPPVELSELYNYLESLVNQ